MGRQPVTDPNASTLVSKLGATADRSRAGRLSLTLDGVTVDVAADAAKPALSEARAVYDLIAALSMEAATEQARTDYAAKLPLALSEWKVLGYTELATVTSEKAATAIIARKLAYWTTTRDTARKAAP